MDLSSGPATLRAWADELDELLRLIPEAAVPPTKYDKTNPVPAAAAYGGRPWQWHTLVARARTQLERAAGCRADLDDTLDVKLDAYEQLDAFRPTVLSDATGRAEAP